MSLAWNQICRNLKDHYGDAAKKHLHMTAEINEFSVFDKMLWAKW